MHILITRLKISRTETKKGQDDSFRHSYVEGHTPQVNLLSKYYVNGIYINVHIHLCCEEKLQNQGFNVHVYEKKCQKWLFENLM